MPSADAFLGIRCTTLHAGFSWRACWVNHQAPARTLNGFEMADEYTYAYLVPSGVISTLSTSMPTVERSNLMTVSRLPVTGFSRKTPVRAPSKTYRWRPSDDHLSGS